MINNSQSLPASSNDHGLKKELRLWDLVPMQILLVMGITWAGIAAKQGGTQVAFWMAGVLFLFVPLAATVGFCAKQWQEEGGVYQWVKHAMGPFAGFMSAWNFGLWALLVLSNVGILTATSLSYALGPRATWMAGNRLVTLCLTLGLFAVILLVNLPGFGIGRWVAHFGTFVMVAVTLLLVLLLFWHPHASALRPHISPQRSFSFALPVMTMLSINLFSKIAFNSFSGLEQVAVFAGETRNPSRAILLSAWIAAPMVAAIYILMTGSMLTYIPAAQIDLTGPVPQLLSIAFAGGATQRINWGLMLGRGTILVLGIALVAQYSVLLAETSRLPMVAGWDGIVPEWFTRLHPRWKTPTRSTMVIALLAVGAAALSLAGSGNQEAYQLIVEAGNLCYGVYYLLMFMVPLVAGSRFRTKPGVFLKIAAMSGIAVTLLQMGFSLLPIVPVASKWAFAGKIAGSAVALNLVAVGVYWWSTRKKINSHAA